MAHEPNTHPTPVASGGTRQTGYRTLRGALGTDVRQPDLGSCPNVVSVAGFGSAGGAHVRSQGSGADQSQGIVAVQCGLVPASSGSIVLRFPIAPTSGQYWAAADWASLSPSVAGNNLTLAWTATRPILPNERLTLAYQWSVSQ